MEKRYQVFVSSTFKDLEQERQEVMHALLELDCMPSGMELFPAANETQWNLIKKVIDDCDYYVLIIGGRYGSIGPDGISYTEMEYQYALSKGKPTIAFLHKDPGKIPAEKTESSVDGKAGLQAFRSSAEKKLCKYWSSPQELGSVVSRSLIQLIKSTPAIGWVRANELADREATIELLQLRRKVEDLQRELSQMRTSAPSGSEGLAQGDENHTMELSLRVYSEKKGFKTYRTTCDATWNQIFSTIAPLMINEAAESMLKKSLDAFVGKCVKPTLSKDPKLNYDSFFLLQQDFHTIKVQLRALGLIAMSHKARSLKDSGTYWKLTPYGDEVMTQMLAIRKYQEAPLTEEQIATQVAELKDGVD